MEGRFFTAGSFPQISPFKGRVAVAEDREAVTAPIHDPPLEPRDEAVFLLTAAAEIEHALMVQYLYAAWSVRVEGEHVGELTEVRDLLVQIAREEMGHLATVQNLLHLVGGPLNLGREHSPYASAVYPFRFALEPVTLGSLSKYVTAESPEGLPSGFPEADEDLLDAIRDAAAAANGGQPVRHVGPIFARLAHLFDEGLADDDVAPDTAARQAGFRDWGWEPGSEADGEALIIRDFPGADPRALRDAATAAVHEIGAQGEGFDVGAVGSESHFERFLAVYKRVRDLTDAGVEVTWPVARDPNTTPEGPPAVDVVEAALEESASVGRIGEPRARGWAQLFNLRYRLLLGMFSHFLRLDQELYSAAPGPRRGDPTARGLLLIWTFDEMRRLSKIAGKLVRMPKDPHGQVHAGPPFELPYTLALPDGEPSRWRAHLDTSRAAVRLVRDQLQPEGTADPDPFLEEVVARDVAAQDLLRVLAHGGDVPPESLPTGFAKAVGILEEAVRGFRIGRHGNFWADRTREEFLAQRPFGQPPIALNPDQTVDPTPDNAPLIQMLGAGMPRFRPPVPPDRVAYLRTWIADGAPDDDPAGGVGVRNEAFPASEAPVEPAGPGFAAQIRPLFRDQDRASMLFLFDLHSVDDVRTHAAAIDAEIAAGRMPCDAPWPAERLAVFRQWVADGMAP